MHNGTLVVRGCITKGALCFSWCTQIALKDQTADAQIVRVYKIWVHVCWYLILVEVNVTKFALLEAVHQIHLLIGQTDIRARHLVMDRAPGKETEKKVMCQHQDQHQLLGLLFSCESHRDRRAVRQKNIILRYLETS